MGSGAHKTCKISKTVQDSTKSHMCLWLVPTSMTLD